MRTTVKAESVTNSVEERVAADKSFSTKDKSMGREWECVEERSKRGGGGGVSGTHPSIRGEWEGVEGRGTSMRFTLPSLYGLV